MELDLRYDPPHRHRADDVDRVAVLRVNPRPIDIHLPLVSHIYGLLHDGSYDHDTALLAAISAPVR
jgi:hypothetical protein